MDIRIESNIGLDIINIECIQQLLVELRATYSESSLLMINFHLDYEEGVRTKVSLTLFDNNKTERLSGIDRNPHGLLTNLLNQLIDLKRKKDIPTFIPIRSYKSGDLGQAI